jgi:DNA-binding XRE family transcriptional regulator
MKTPQEICTVIGKDISACRKVRRMSSAELALRIESSRATVSRMENGDPGVAFGLYVKAAIIFGMENNIADIFAPQNDTQAARLGREALPRRVREKSPESSLGDLDF